MSFQASVVQKGLAERLKALRAKSGLTTREVAEQLGWAPSKVSRIENAQNKISPRDVDKLCQLYEVREPTATELREMAQVSRTDIWYQRYEPFLPKSYYDLISYEDEAVRVCTSQPTVVPGQLQTREYVRAIVASSPTSYDEETAEALIDVRMQRQGRLYEPVPLQLDAVIAEAVLYWQYGGRAVLMEQLKHLREMADRSNVNIRLLPYSAASYLLPLEVYLFGPEQDTAVAFSETLWSNQLHEGQQETTRALRMFGRHVNAALSAEESVQVLEQRIREIGK